MEGQLPELIENMFVLFDAVRTMKSGHYFMRHEWFPFF